MQYQIPLIAGQQLRHNAQGRMITLQDLGAASYVQMVVEWHGSQRLEDLGQQARGFQIASAEPFSTVLLTAPVNTTVRMLVTAQEVRISDVSGDPIDVVLDAGQLPLPVTIDGPDPLPVSMAAVPAPTAVAYSYMAVPDFSALGFVGLVTHRRVVIGNHGPGDVAVAREWPGPAFNRRAIVIAPGQSYVEESLAGVPLVWSFVCRAGETAQIGIEVWT